MMNSSKNIALWLLTGCFLIFCMVVIGGITRLTGSGLSITEWKPIMGAVPPLNDHEWEVAFQKYKQIPQFTEVNTHFKISDFKQIFWWEWIHRQIGRLIGLVFIIPFLFFLFKKQFDKTTFARVLLLFFLGGLQGFLGWLMVQSGLSERTSVSHLRLAVHLITAFITFGFTFYFALALINKKKSTSYRSPLMKWNILLMMIVIVQIIYGAFVAGLHAGTMFNSFPLMNGSFVPSGISALHPFWINLFENPVTVQFIHRLMAFVIVLLTTFIYYHTRKMELNPALRKGIKILILAVFFQFTIGILTLLSGAQIALASAHQIGAFFLFSGGVYLIYHSRHQVI